MSKPLGSYPWYPEGWLWTELRFRMTPAERGVYRDFLDWYFIHGGLSTEERALLTFSACESNREFLKIWKRISQFFEIRDGRYHPKTDHFPKPAFKRSPDSRRHTVSPKLRFKILERDEYKCQYCGAGIDTCPLDIDHVLPVAKGGTNHPSNLVAACSTCNSGKGANCIGGASLA